MMLHLKKREAVALTLAIKELQLTPELGDLYERLQAMIAAQGDKKDRRTSTDEISYLRSRLADAETSLRIWDREKSSEYWLRHRRPFMR